MIDNILVGILTYTIYMVFVTLIAVISGEGIVQDNPETIGQWFIWLSIQPMVLLYNIFNYKITPKKKKKK